MSKIKNLFFSLTIIIGFFLIAEVIARFFYTPDEYKKQMVKEYGPQKDDFYIRHKTIGWIFLPGYNGIPEIYKKINRFETFSINSQGLRDKDYSFTKPQNTVRLFCSGDSITMGTVSTNDDTYPKVLERILNHSAPKRANKTYEVINGGVCDYNTFQEYMLLKEIGIRYNPDIVILQYYPNDGRFYVPAKRMFYQESLDKFYSKSAFLYFLDRGLRRIMISAMKKQWENGRERWIPSYESNKWKRDKNEMDALIELADKDWGVTWRKVGWKEVETQLKKMLELAQEKKFQLVIVYFPTKMEVESSGSIKYDMQKPEKDLQKFCSDHNLPFISLTQHLKKFIDQKIYVDHCHYTKRGTEIISQFIADSLAALQVL